MSPVLHRSRSASRPRAGTRIGAGARTARWVRLFVGLLLIPLSVGLARALIGATAEAVGASTILSLDAGIFAFLVGFCGYALCYVFLPRPTRAYVWAHEVTHVLFGRLHGARSRDFRVEEDHGSVVLSKTNLLTLLAPYFFPLYAVALVLLLLLVSLWCPLERLRVPGLALLGVAWGFHACFTLDSMLQHQTDLERGGYVFSYAWVIFLNLLVLSAGLLAVTSFPLRLFLLLWHDHAVAAYSVLWGAVGQGIRTALGWLRAALE